MLGSMGFNTLTIFFLYKYQLNLNLIKISQIVGNYVEIRNILLMFLFLSHDFQWFYACIDF